MPSAKLIVTGSGNESVGGHFYGAAYGYKLDGNPVVTIEYFTLSGGCPVGPVYNATPPNFVSPSVAVSAAYVSGASRCFLLLPDN